MTGDGGLLERYDREERQREFVAGPGYRLEWDGPAFRLVGPGPQPWENAVLYVREHPAGPTAASAAAVIDRQIGHFAALGHAFEWKLFDHDPLHALANLLAERGLVAEERETVVVFPTSAEFPGPAPPAGVHIESVSDEAGLREVGDLNHRVYGDREHADWLAQSLIDESRAAPDALSVLVARAGAGIVAAGWLRLPKGTTFASLWGGATLPAWRGRGLYTALVARRIEHARRRGFAHVTVDCGPQSLPILLRRGFNALTTITPWIWRPPSTAAEGDDTRAAAG